MNALVIVDVQNDFIPGGALGVPEGDRVVPVINALQPHFDLVVGTKDWHPENHGSFAASHPGRAIGDVVDLNGVPQILWPIHCVQGTHGAEFVAPLDRSRWDRVFTKGIDADIDSYSALFDNEHLRATGLDGYLRENKVDELYLAGLATDYCVKFTALDARGLGFRTIVIADACRGVELHPGDTQRAFDEMRAAGVEILTSADVLTQLGGRS